MERLGFGQYAADHQFAMTYRDGQWQNPRIEPFSPLSLSPFALGLHYGQTVFEGMKAFRQDNGKIAIFRPDRHHERFNHSLARMCMPPVPADWFIDGLKALVDIDRAWVPDGDGQALYIRPFMFATEARLGLKIAEEYEFMIVTTPVEGFYPKPIKVKVETEYVRAAEGGTGMAKCGGNYGGALYPTQLARQAGYEQVIWTDAKNHEYLEELGTMNLMLIQNGTVVTPPLRGTILDGITRDSLLTLAAHLGLPVEQKALTVTDLQNGLVDGSITEVFGAGTAAIVAPISTIGIHGKDYNLPTLDQPLHRTLKQSLLNIQHGKSHDCFGWNVLV